MPKGLRRRHGGGERHFITCSCYHRIAFLASARRRDVFLKILEEVRRKFDFVVCGYVVMPEHFHLLITEPRVRTDNLAPEARHSLAHRVSGGCKERSMPAPEARHSLAHRVSGGCEERSMPAPEARGDMS